MMTKYILAHGGQTETDNNCQCPKYLEYQLKFCVCAGDDRWR